MGFDVSQKLSLDLHNGARDFQLLELTSDLHKPTSDFQLWEFDLWLQLGKLSESDINLKTPSLRSFLFILRRNNWLTVRTRRFSFVFVANDWTANLFRYLLISLWFVPFISCGCHNSDLSRLVTEICPIPDAADALAAFSFDQWNKLRVICSLPSQFFQFLFVGFSV